jgi:hypothetical protein
MSNRRRAGYTNKVRVNDVPRSALPLPPARWREQPFAYSPETGELVAPWPRGSIEPEDEALLIAVLDQTAQLHGALRVPVWLWPDDTRAPVPISADRPGSWFARYGESRAVYRDRRDLGPR